MPIRLATAADLPAINDIYNHYVTHSTATYQTEPATLHERRQWFDAHGPAHPITILEIEGLSGGVSGGSGGSSGPLIVGWASLSKFHPRAAYGRTVESSVYIHHAQHRHGHGRTMMLDILARARACHHHTVLACISADQMPSVRLHEALGFIQCALLREVGHKWDQWLDVIWLQLMLNAPAGSPLTPLP